jgi:hypothetical protein
MLWSSHALLVYLYGIKAKSNYDIDNQLIISTLNVSSHKSGEKEIPSGYFFQPNSEYVSAVLFSSNATISKFNRMGRQAGFGDPNVIISRYGKRYDHDPNSCSPIAFQYEVNENSQETWGEGLSMFHNPNAIHPVPEELFPSIAHHHFQDGQFVSIIPDFYPFFSISLNIKIKR